MQLLKLGLSKPAMRFSELKVVPTQMVTTFFIGNNQQ